MAKWTQRNLEVNSSVASAHKSQPTSDAFVATPVTAPSALPPLIDKILSSRGLSSEKERDLFLNPKLSLLKDPFLLQGMSQAVERLVQAYLQNEKICIYADFDLDGTSGLAILKEAFEKLGYKQVAFYQPKRLSEGYGFHPHAVEELKNLGIDLIITVDVGITSFAAFEKAQELGIDVILTDHHLPLFENGKEILPKAFCVVNPNQQLCMAGLGYLCGAGVAFYLVRALKRAFTEQVNLPKQEWDLKELLDLFCIGTLTDMVPLIEDNRVLVKHGMVALEKTQRPGLRALLDHLDLSKRPLTSQDISIRFAPKLNALSRMESDILPIHIYLEKSSQKAEDLVNKILKNNNTRQNIQQLAEEKSLELLKSWSHKDFVYVCAQDFHRGVIGLIATKLSKDFNCPAFVGSLNSEGMIVGSARLPSGFEGNLTQALKSSDSVLTRFGGHAAAAGFELAKNNELQFIDNLKNYYSEQKKHPKELEYEFDVKAELGEISQNFMKWHDFLGPFGVGFHIPVFRFNSLKLEKIKELKGGHLKLSFSHAEQTIDVLYFSPIESKKQEIQTQKNYDILGELQMNYFGKQKSIQVLLKDFKLHENNKSNNPNQDIPLS